MMAYSMNLWKRLLKTLKWLFRDLKLSLFQLKSLWNRSTSPNQQDYLIRLTRRMCIQTDPNPRVSARCCQLNQQQTWETLCLISLSFNREVRKGSPYNKWSKRLRKMTVLTRRIRCFGRAWPDSKSLSMKNLIESPVKMTTTMWVTRRTRIVRRVTRTNPSTLVKSNCLRSSSLLCRRSLASLHRRVGIRLAAVHSGQSTLPLRTTDRWWWWHNSSIPLWLLGSNNREQRLVRKSAVSFKRSEWIYL
jgi:hypothetical protein